MSTAYKKVWRDLWRNKGRTFMVVISIAVGVMAVGMAVGTRFYSLAVVACAALVVIVFAGSITATLPRPS